MLLCSAALLPGTGFAQAASEPGTASAAAVDSAWILQRLARPAPMHTDFVELRESPLLKEPLRLSGQYLRPREDTLVRQVREPYVETTTIVTGRDGAGQATIARAGRQARSFALSRVPQLAVLQASFGALLAGDRVLLDRHYRVQASGTRRQWQMTLVPRQPQLAAQVRDIVLHGRGAELRCIETRPPTGPTQRTLLASSARQVAAGVTPTAFAALCRGNGS